MPDMTRKEEVVDKMINLVVTLTTHPEAMPKRERDPKEYLCYALLEFEELASRDDVSLYVIQTILRIAHSIAQGVRHE